MQIVEKVDFYMVYICSDSEWWVLCTKHQSSVSVSSMLHKNSQFKIFHIPNSILSSVSSIIKTYSLYFFFKPNPTINFIVAHSIWNYWLYRYSSSGLFSEPASTSWLMTQNASASDFPGSDPPLRRIQLKATFLHRRRASRLRASFGDHALRSRARLFAFEVAPIVTGCAKRSSSRARERRRCKLIHDSIARSARPPASVVIFFLHIHAAAHVYADKPPVLIACCPPRENKCCNSGPHFRQLYQQQVCDKIIKTAHFLHCVTILSRFYIHLPRSESEFLLIPPP